MSVDPSPTVAGLSSLQHVGSGAFSRVYRARQLRLDRDVAVKVLQTRLDSPAARETFNRECRAMARLRHPNIVTIHDTAETDDGQPCLIMEYYDGGSWADQMTGEALGLAPVLDLGVRIADALHAAHEIGIFHRDIKPQNIFLTLTGSPAVGDFGIATLSAVVDRAREVGPGAGAAGGWTLHYAAPEVLEGGEYTAAADVWSLCASLYRALAGHRPFDGSARRRGELRVESGRGEDIRGADRVRLDADPDDRSGRDAAVRARVIEATPAPFATDGGGPLLDAAVNDLIVSRGLAKEPSDRIGSADELARELQALQRRAGLPVTARPSVHRVGAGPRPAAPKPMSPNDAGRADNRHRLVDTARASSGRPLARRIPLMLGSAVLIALVVLTAVALLRNDGDTAAPTDPRAATVASGEIETSTQIPDADAESAGIDANSADAAGAENNGNTAVDGDLRAAFLAEGYPPEEAACMAAAAARVAPAGELFDALPERTQVALAREVSACAAAVGGFAPGASAPGETRSLDTLWDRCAMGRAFACDRLYFDSPVGSTYEAFGISCGGRSVVPIDCGLLMNGRPSAPGWLDEDGQPDRAAIAEAAQQGSPSVDPAFDELWVSCADDGGAACTALALEAPPGTLYAAFGATCGGRLDDATC